MKYQECFARRGFETKRLRLEVSPALCVFFRHFRKIHVRSPELFDELVLADGKKKAWAPRANKITGQWFDQIKNLKDVSANLMFLKSEDGSVVCRGP